MSRRNALALGLALLLAAPVPSAAAAPEDATATAAEDATAATPEATTGTWLRLRGDDDDLRERMDAALHDEARARGLVEGESALQIDEVECELADTACLTAVGRRLRTQSLLFGALSSDDIRQLRLARLDVVTGTLVREYQQPLASDQLAGEGFVRVVADAITALAVEGDPAWAPQASPSPVLAAPAPPPPPAPEVASDAPPDAAPGRLRWGLAVRTPRWQWAGFGTGIAIATLGLVSGAVASAQLRTSLPEKLAKAVQDSLTDAKATNDIPPSTPDYCVLARQSSDGGKTVKNVRVTSLCNDGESFEKLQIAGFATFGVGLATTLVFTGLLYLHRGKALRRDARRPSVTAWTTGRAGGVMWTGRF